VVPCICIAWICIAYLVLPVFPVFSCPDTYDSTKSMFEDGGSEGVWRIVMRCTVGYRTGRDVEREIFMRK